MKLGWSLSLRGIKEDTNIKRCLAKRRCGLHMLCQMMFYQKNWTGIKFLCIMALRWLGVFFYFWPFFSRSCHRDATLSPSNPQCFNVLFGVHPSINWGCSWQFFKLLPGQTLCVQARYWFDIPMTFCTWLNCVEVYLMHFFWKVTVKEMVLSYTDQNVTPACA